jgi:hypothetical protein
MNNTTNFNNSELRELNVGEVDAVSGAGALILAGAGALLIAGAMAAGEAYLNYQTKWYATR